VAIVTGASRSIGRAIGWRWRARAREVVAAARGDHAAAVAAEITAAGGQAVAVPVDVTDAALVAAMVAGTLERFGRVDVLVNNAGITRDQLMLRMKPEDWDAVVRTNLTAAFTCTQAVLRPMIRQRGGRIISIGSVVVRPGTRAGELRRDEGGLIGFNKSLALGGVAGRHGERRGAGAHRRRHDAALRRRRATRGPRGFPLGRLGRPEDVADAVCFLASDEASYITGQVLAVNGGMYT
jgi:3-oxoacyl-[acyl-carrier protein] reductase